MNILQAIILGLVQGITEVLPISSSGHLVLFPWLFHFPDPGLPFDVALHMGTLIAIVAFFASDWIKIVKGFLSGISKMKFRSQEEKLSLLIVFATVPGAVAGALLDKYAENTFRNPLLIAGTTFLFAFALIFAEKKNSSLSSRAQAEGSLKNGRKGFLRSSLQEVGRNDNGKKIGEENSKNAILTGLAQAVAIIPGVSRSGITISAGMLQGFTRETAARFSFLISAPIILGAGIMEVRKIPFAEFQTAVFWAGFISSVLASFLTVRFLMNFIKTHNLNIFAYYRFGLAALIVVVYFLTK